MRRHISSAATLSAVDAYLRLHHLHPRPVRRPTLDLVAATPQDAQAVVGRGTRRVGSRRPGSSCRCPARRRSGAARAPPRAAATASARSPSSRSRPTKRGPADVCAGMAGDQHRARGAVASVAGGVPRRLRRDAAIPAYRTCAHASGPGRGRDAPSARQRVTVRYHEHRFGTRSAALRLGGEDDDEDFRPIAAFDGDPRPGPGRPGVRDGQRPSPPLSTAPASFPTAVRMPLCTVASTWAKA